MVKGVERQDDAGAAPGELTRLPPGRHGLPRETVVRSQRDRMLKAMAESVAEKGYAMTTVSDVTSRAGVSRRTFYERFSNKAECFVALYDSIFDMLEQRIRDAASTERPSDWRTIARSSVETAARTFAEEPAIAVTMLIHSIAAGDEALDRRARYLDRFADLWRRLYERGRKLDPGLPPLPQALFRAVVASQDEMMRDILRRDGAEALPRHAEHIWRTSMELLGAWETAGR